MASDFVAEKRDSHLTAKHQASGLASPTTDGIIFVQSPLIPERLDSSAQDSEFTLKYSDSLTFPTTQPDISEALPVIRAQTDGVDLVCRPDAQSVILHEKQAAGLDTTQFRWKNGRPVSIGWKRAEDV